MVINVEKHYKFHIFLFALISFQLFILVSIAFISKFIAVAICIGVLLHIKKIKFEFNRWYELVLFLIVNVYLTFAFFGYDLFLDNDSNIVKLINLSYSDLSNPESKASFIAGAPYIHLFYFGLGFIWTSYVLQSFLDAIKSLVRAKNRLCVLNNGYYWKKWLILLAIMFVMFMIWQRAFNPIVMSPDSWGYIDGWYTGSYNSFRSPVYAFLVSVICNLAPTKPEVQWIAIMQIMLFSALLATILMYLHKRWFRLKYIILAAIVLPLIPSLGLYTIVVWVDLACGMSILWLTYALVRIIDEVVLRNTASKRQRLSFYAQLCFSLVLTYFIRSNSFLVYLVMAPVLALLFVLWKQWKFFASVIFSVVMVLLIQLPGYNALNVIEGPNEQLKYYAAIHDIQATYYSGGRLSEQTKAALRKYVTKLDDPDAKAAFRPDWVLYEAEYYAYDFNGLAAGEFFSMYIDSFVNNPLKMVKSMLYRVRTYLVIDAKGYINCVGYTAIYDPQIDANATQAPEIGVYRQHNFLTTIMTHFTMGAALPVPAIFIWRFGIWTALMVVSIMTLLLERRYIWLLTYLPVFVYLATLFLTSGWTDYRYGLPVFFVGLFLPLVLVLLHPANTEKGKVK